MLLSIARFLYCTFIIYSAIRLSSRKCPIDSVLVIHSSFITPNHAAIKNKTAHKIKTQ